MGTLFHRLLHPPGRKGGTDPELAFGSRGHRLLNQWLLLGVVLLSVTLMLTRGITKGEFSVNVDETFHACTGLYIASFLHDLPLRHPIEYTYLYYAHYPALDIIAYPPVFYIAEGVMFLIFGPSAVTARLTVLLFALFGLYFWFRLVAFLRDEVTAAVATIVVASLPSVLLYEKAAMLEIPAMAFCLAASYFWIRYLRDGASRLVYWFSVLAGLAILSKAQTIYLGLWCLLSVIATGKWRLVWNRATMVGLTVCAVMVAPYYVLSFRFARSIAKANVLQGANLAVHPFLYYLEAIPGQIGWVILGLAILGIVTLRYWEKRENASLILTWILACYITETAIANKEARYIIYWIPAYVYLAVSPLGAMLQRPGWSRRLGGAIMLALLTGCTATAWSYQRPYVSGYARMAGQLVHERGGFVLIDAPLDGNFIFFLRALDPARRFVVCRKALYVERQVKEYGYLELARSTVDIENIIRDDGIRYIIIDEEMNVSYEAESALREVLKNPQFRRIGEVAIDSNDPDYRGHTLALYENTIPSPSPAGTYRIKMLTLDHDISVPRAALDPSSPSQ